MQLPLRLLLLAETPADSEFQPFLVPFFQKPQWVTTAVSSMGEALDYLYEAPFEAILIDLTMPHAPDLEAIAHLCRTFSDVAVIVLTEAEQDLGLQAIQQGAQDYLAKDTATEGLVERSLHCAIGRVRYQSQKNASEFSSPPVVARPPIEKLKVSNLYRPEKQEELATQEANQPRIVKFPGEMVVRSRPDTTITFINEFACQILECQAEDVIGQQWLSFLAEQSPSLVLGQIQQLTPESPTFTLEHQVTTGNQQDAWYEWINTGIFEAGKIVEIVGIGRDITNRKRAAISLRHSEYIYNALIQPLPDLILRMSGDGKYLDFFPTDTFHVLGSSDIVGCSIFDGSIPYELATQRMHHIQKALQTGEMQVYEQTLEIEGVIHTEEVRITVCGDHEVLIIVRDITDLKQTEAALYQLNQELEARVKQRTGALQESEERFRQIFEQSPLGIAISDLDGCISRLNASLSAMLECPASTLLDQSIYDLLQSHQQDDIPQLQQILEHTLTIVSFECQPITKTGKKLWVNVTSALIFNVFGRPSSILHLIEDISDRKQTEAQLQQVNERLTLTNAELYRATRMKDEFLAVMSHELRTPLNAILGMSEGLLEGILGDLSDRQKHSVSIIERSGKHLLDLINDILDLSKIEAGKLEIQLAPASVKSLCENSLAFVKQQAFKKQIQLTVDIAEALPNIVVDERRIRQTIINLLSNAVKFTPDGGSVTLKVHSLQRATQPWLQFAVVDTGIGIAPDDVKQLFTPFAQVDSSLNRQYEGTGLGLALVRRLVELHQGEVGATSTLGQGSCFTICLPYIVSPLAAMVGPELEQPLASQGALTNPLQPFREAIAPSKAQSISTITTLPTAKIPTILLAEDNPANVDTLSCYLESRSFQVRVAKNGREAITLAQQFPPDLILMDIQMPDIDGLEAIRILRSEPQFATIPIIALTALAMVGDRERCLAAGANDYLAKPIPLKALVETIQQFLMVS